MMTNSVWKYKEMLLRHVTTGQNRHKIFECGSTATHYNAMQYSKVSEKLTSTPKKRYTYIKTFN
jgi:hypothetical protein